MWPAAVLCIAVPDGPGSQSFWFYLIFFCSLSVGIHSLLLSDILSSAFLLTFLAISLRDVERHNPVYRILFLKESK